MIPRLAIYALLACAVLAIASWAFFKMWRVADERADVAEARLLKQEVITKIVTEYVHDIRYLPAPDSVIAARVDRLCDARMRADRPGADGAAQADADHRRGRDLDREFRATWENKRQLEAVQKAARAAGCAR